MAKKLKKKTKKVKKESFFKKIKQELKLVKWPEGKDVLKYTIATLVVCLIFCGVFMLLNLGLSIIKGWL